MCLSSHLLRPHSGPLSNSLNLLVLVGRGGICGLLTVVAWGLSYSSEPSAEPPLGAKLALGCRQEKRVGHTYHHHLLSSTVLQIPRAPELRENRSSSPYLPHPYLSPLGSPVHDSHCRDLSELTQRQAGHTHFAQLSHIMLTVL